MAETKKAILTELTDGYKPIGPFDLQCGRYEGR